VDIEVIGMHGLGDNLHQRAVVRGLNRNGHRVWLRTPWPQVYGDLVGASLRLLPAGSSLRTQAKNEAVSSGYYANHGPPPGARRLRVWYTPDGVRKHGGSILRAMLAGAGLPPADDDFRLPVPPEWKSRAQAAVGRLARPIMLYRPLVERTEWAGCSARNPDAYAYGTLAASLAGRYSVVSVADVQPGAEWISGADLPADLRLVRGELGVEALVGLAAVADLIFCSPGFAAVLGQAVGTPVVCVFGGHERGLTISAGARYAPTLAVDPVQPCDCFDRNHGCDKRIDIPGALARLKEFADGAATSTARAA
jgi:hypothetical protein